ncbi:MAG: hypothetical protein A3H93_03280 [Rhodocyclales bacterium RIFCSPLOWO2_02_FULL_63_24]|nr:MAG: hypothetical protein A2040_18615 [Rhodocyclales bacterium GWA2_65_19]OHC68003.1 MAG: hypothetical protein A3H93_03280 [Rhodocyclales bacterium RIFCSPLOWO2_02_FULL_63_24]
MVTMIPETPPDFDRTRIIERPDGFYWLDQMGDDEYGPFPTILDAVADMEFGAASDYEPGESLAQAESEVGMSEWVDPETGEPAENGAPRLEQH